MCLKSPGLQRHIYLRVVGTTIHRVSTSEAGSTTESAIEIQCQDTWCLSVVAAILAALDLELRFLII